MATETETPIVNNVNDQLKNLLTSLTDQQSQIKGLINSVRTILKDVDKQSREFDKLKNKKSRTRSERKASDTPSGITKPVAISDELAIFLGVEPGTLVPRNEVTKGVSSYVKKYDLSDPTNKQKFALTEKPEGLALMKLLGNPVDTVTYFNLQRYLKHHYIQAAPADAGAAPAEVVSTKSSSSKSAPVAAPVTTDSASTSGSDKSGTKKVKIIKRKKESAGGELTEE
jgi:hypothetical protein